MSGTFMIRTGPQKSDVREHPYELEFELLGEVWVVHRRLHGIGYCLSHKATGFRVPGIDRERAVEVKFHGSEYLNTHREKIAAVIAKAKL
jgi:hypothetical protein